MNNRILKASAEEIQLIEELTSRPAFERLDAGEAEIVNDDDWSGVPEIHDTRELKLPAALYRKLKAASRKRHTTPAKLACRLLTKELQSS